MRQSRKKKNKTRTQSSSTTELDPIKQAYKMLGRPKLTWLYRLILTRNPRLRITPSENI